MPDKMSYKDKLAMHNDALCLASDHDANVSYYKEWLREHAKQDKDSRLADSYNTAALIPVFVRNREIRSFAPFQYDLSAFTTFTSGQIVCITFVVSLLIAGLLFKNALTLLCIALCIASIHILYFLFISSLSLFAFFQSPEEKIEPTVIQKLTDVEWPTYTILCPLYQEGNVLPQLIQALQNLEYPCDKLQILLLLEEFDDETRDALKNIELPPHFHSVTLPRGEPRTKPRSCNFGLTQASGEYIVIYDAEDIPDPLQLKKAILTFAKGDPSVACLQAKLNFYNTDQNILTRWFTLEYSARYDLTLPGIQGAQLAIPLGGTSNHFRTEMLRSVGAWDVYNVTEDCDMGIRLAHRGLKTAMLDSTTFEEANSELKNWLRQRSRWIKGFMQTYLVYMRNPWQYIAREKWAEFLSLQCIIGSRFISHLANPVLWIILIYSMLVSLLLENASYAFLLVFYISLFGLIVGNLLPMGLYSLGCIKRRQYHLLKWALLLPCYEAITGIAACIALYQLIVKPHYWEKTQHGLHQ